MAATPTVATPTNATPFNPMELWRKYSPSRFIKEKVFQNHPSYQVFALVLFIFILARLIYQIYHWFIKKPDDSNNSNQKPISNGQ